MKKKGYITGSGPRSKKALLYSLSYSLMHMVPVDANEGYDPMLAVIDEIIQKAHHQKKRKIALTIRSVNMALMDGMLCDVYGNKVPLFMYEPQEVKDEFKKLFNRKQIAEICQDENFTIFQEKYWGALRVLMIVAKRRVLGEEAVKVPEEKVVQ